ncbi:hypothetical protein FDO65_10130 [Nakamurella flava]|uniref:Uncharacterized protein n=1 Tax=Nakamurella flava TaxID=2576308 RepID=A0A4U6QP79_9ACTN|nr:hypothetical protein [Nakamurella flava]TKV61872.1 hypothetical protein FDO65_10130 [Nakamurella flava]
MSVAISLSPFDDPDLPPGMRLTVTSDQLGTVPLEVWRVHPDGSEHRVISSSRPYLIAGAWVETDIHAPYNVDVTWRVQSSAGSASTVGTVYSEFSWLVPPSEPTTAVRLDEVVNLSSRQRETRAAKFQPVSDGSNGDNPKPIFVSDGGRGGTGVTATVRVLDEQPLWRLLDSDTVLLLITPGPGWRVKWMWAQVTRDEWANPGRAWWPYDDVVLTLDESADPDAELMPIWTDGDVHAWALANGLTEGGVAAAYATDLDMQVNNRTA